MTTAAVVAGALAFGALAGVLTFAATVAFGLRALHHMTERPS